MSVQFDEDQTKSYSGHDDNGSGLVKKLVKMGLAKDDKQAEFILLISSLIFVVITIFIFVNLNKSSKRVLSPEESRVMVQKMQQRAQEFYSNGTELNQ